jgi:hypothetical protein
MHYYRIKHYCHLNILLIEILTLGSLIWGTMGKRDKSLYGILHEVPRRCLPSEFCQSRTTWLCHAEPEFPVSE